MRRLHRLGRRSTCSRLSDLAVTCEGQVEDSGINPLGVKGVGEVGQVGAAAAIANAVFNATGRRIRELPLAASSSWIPRIGEVNQD